MRYEQAVFSLVSIYFRSPLGMHNQTVYSFRLSTQRYTQFWIFRKGSENSFFTFLMLYSINWPNFIVWSSKLTLSSVSTRFSRWWKSHDRKLNILRRSRAFRVFMFLDPQPLDPRPQILLVFNIYCLFD